MRKITKHYLVTGRSAQELFLKTTQALEALRHQPGLPSLEIIELEALQQIKIQSTLFSALLCCEEGKMTFHVETSLLGLAFQPQVNAWLENWMKKTFLV